VDVELLYFIKTLNTLVFSFSTYPVTLKHPHIQIGANHVNIKVLTSNCDTTSPHERIVHKITFLALALVRHQ
jgi:hypothetical protein